MIAVPLALPLNVEESGEIRMYRFVLPFTPPSKNVYDGWPNEWKHSLKKKWMRHVIQCLEESLVPKGVPKIGLAATLVFPTAARRDTQNYAQALWHFVPDALVRYGAIRDDTPEHLEIGPNWGIRMLVDDRKVDKKFRARTHLALTMRVPEHLL